MVRRNNPSKYSRKVGFRLRLPTHESGADIALACVIWLRAAGLDASFPCFELWEGRGE